MAFWGVEVKPGNPYVHESSRRGRLRITQATLGNYNDVGWTTLECSVGDARPVRLCALSSTIIMYRLDLEYEEKDNVVLSVLGNCSVHLSGYYIHCHNVDHGSYTEKLKPSGKATSHAYLKRKDPGQDTDDMNFGSLRNPIICDVDDSGGSHISKPIVLSNTRTSKKRKSKTPSIEAVPNYQNNDMNRTNGHRHSKILDSNRLDIAPGQSREIIQEENDIHSAGQGNKAQGDKVHHESAHQFIRQKCKTPSIELLNDQSNGTEQGSKEAGNYESIHHGDGALIHKKILDSGMLIEDLESGGHNAEIASEGNMIRVKYVGKLKDGKAFDPPEGSGIYDFELGAGHVILGWDHGIIGMRVGGRRRLTIPPALGYGDKPLEVIPSNSWLIYEVELLNVLRP